jgi:hypothetical protein
VHAVRWLSSPTPTTMAMSGVPHVVDKFPCMVVAYTHEIFIELYTRIA